MSFGAHALYGASHIVQGIDLAVRAGKVVGVFGRNGVGKTTLLKTIAGWIRASRGEIRFDGMRIDGAAPDPHLPPRRRLRAGGSPDFPRAHGGGKPDARFHAGAAARQLAAITVLMVHLVLCCSDDTACLTRGAVSA